MGLSITIIETKTFILVDFLMHVVRINIGLPVTIIGTFFFILMNFLMHVARMNMGLSATIKGIILVEFLKRSGAGYNYFRNKNNFFILVDFLMHVARISLGLPIFYVLWCISAI